MSQEGSIFSINKKIIDGISMASNINSEIVDIAELIGYCVHAIWTGSPVGNIIISGSNDGINFKAIDTTAAGGAGGQRLFEVDRAHYRYVQVTYVFSSGPGVLNAYLSGKRL